MRRSRRRLEAAREARTAPEEALEEKPGRRLARLDIIRRRLPVLVEEALTAAPREDVDVAIAIGIDEDERLGRRRGAGSIEEEADPTERERSRRRALVAEEEEAAIGRSDEIDATVAVEVLELDPARAFEVRDRARDSDPAALEQSLGVRGVELGPGSFDELEDRHEARALGSRRRIRGRRLRSERLVTVENDQLLRAARVEICESDAVDRVPRERERLAERHEVTLLTDFEAEDATGIVRLDDDDDIGCAVIVRVARADAADCSAGIEARVELRPASRGLLHEERKTIRVDRDDLDALNLGTEIGRDETSRLRRARTDHLVHPTSLAFEEPGDLSGLHLKARCKG